MLARVRYITYTLFKPISCVTNCNIFLSKENGLARGRSILKCTLEIKIGQMSGKGLDMGGKKIQIIDLLHEFERRSRSGVNLDGPDAPFVPDEVQPIQAYQPKFGRKEIHNSSHLRKKGS